MVLVIVLWIITLLAVMAGAFAYSMRVETRLAASADGNGLRPEPWPRRGWRLRWRGDWMRMPRSD